jgi:hypothetical protein
MLCGPFVYFHENKQPPAEQVAVFIGRRTLGTIRSA